MNTVNNMPQRSRYLVTDLVGQWVLFNMKGRWGGAAEAFRVLGVSPSTNYVRLQNESGNKFWKPVTDIQLIEVLHTIEPSPAKKERMDDRTLGQIGYNAYGQHSDWKSHDGRPMPRWTEEEAKEKGAIVLPDVVKAHWEAAAEAIKRSVTPG